MVSLVEWCDVRRGALVRIPDELSLELAPVWWSAGHPFDAALRTSRGVGLPERVPSIVRKSRPRAPGPFHITHKMSSTIISNVVLANHVEHILARDMVELRSSTELSIIKIDK
jgi:hypothetical protein